MNTIKAGSILVLLTGGLMAVQGQERLPPPVKEELPTPRKGEYPEFSQLVHKIVVSKLPKEHKDDSGWGQTIPIPERLSLPNLRVRVKVGDRWELPNGMWRKVKIAMDDPRRDVRLQIRELKPLDYKSFRVSMDIDAFLHTDVEGQHWQKGLATIGFFGQADIAVRLYLENDVSMIFDTSKFPPDVKFEPKVTTLKMDLQDFNLKHVALKRVGTILAGDQAREAGNNFKDILRDVMKSLEPQAKDYANEVLARSLKEGKENPDVSTLYKSMLKLPKQ